MNLFIEMITIIAEVALTCFFYSKHINRKNINCPSCIIFLLLYSFVLAFTTFYLSIVFRLTIIILIFFIGNNLIFKIRNIKLLYLTILFFTSSILSDMVCSSVLVLFLNISIQTISNNTIGNLIYYSVAKLIHLVLLLIINNFLNKDKTSNSLLSVCSTNP